MSLPTTVDELLLLAEAEVAQLTDQLLPAYRPGLEAGLTPQRPQPPLRVWPRFRYDVSRAIRTTLGPRLPTYPVDEAVHTLSRHWKLPARQFSDLDDAEQRLARIGQLVGAAGDLVASAPSDPDASRAIAARMAGLIGATSRAVVASAGRAGRGRPDLLASLVQVGREAAAVLDAHAGASQKSALDQVTAEPTTVLDGPAARLVSASLAWRRASAACEPSSEVMIQSAVMSGRVAVAAWKLIDHAVEIGALDEAVREPARQRLRAAAMAWGEVAQSWRGYVTSAPRPEAVRHAAMELNLALADVTGETPGRQQENDPARVLQLVEASQRSLGHVVSLACDQTDIGSSLAHSELLFEGRRRQRTTVEQLRDGHKFVPAAGEHGDSLTTVHRAALRRTAAAVAAGDLDMQRGSRSTPATAIRRASQPLARTRGR